MHTVELLEEAIRAAGALGYGLRQEWLGGAGGGACEIKGQKLLFIDLSLSVPDQLQIVLDLLHRENAGHRLRLTQTLEKALSRYELRDKAA